MSDKKEKLKNKYKKLKKKYEKSFISTISLAWTTNTSTNHIM